MVIFSILANVNIIRRQIEINTKTKYTSIEDILGPSISHEEALQLISSDAEVNEDFCRLQPNQRDNILSFIQGKNGLAITYNNVFQHIFNPDIHPERIESLLSALLDSPVKYKKTLSREGSMLIENGSHLVMDVIVENALGETYNIEMQKIGHMFPGERSSCYVSDAIMRQYIAKKAEHKDHFRYVHMKPVYLIVLMEESSFPLKQVSPEYIHKQINSYSSGAEITSLEHVCYFSLDTFEERVHNVDSRMHAWLTFLSATSPERILELVNNYPDFVELYKEVAMFRQDYKELIKMSLAMLAETDYYDYINELKERREDAKKYEAQIEQMQEANDALQADKDALQAQLQEKAEIIAKYEALLAEQKNK